MDTPYAGQPPSARCTVLSALADIRDDDLRVVPGYNMGNPSPAVYQQSYLAAKFA
jgi:hypothetical protein